MARKLNKENEVIEYYKSGKTKEEIMSLIPCSKSYVEVVLHNAGLLVPHLKTKEEEMNVLNLYSQGLSKDKIYHMTGIAPSTQWRIFKKYGFNTRQGGNYRKYSFDNHYFDVIDTPNKAYVIGLIISDGNISTDGYSLRITLQSSDKKILEQINEDMKNTTPLSFLDKSTENEKWNDQYRLELNSKELCNTLSGYGIHPNKSLSIKYPDMISPKYNKDIIRGILDGDGNIDIKRNGKPNQVRITGTIYICESIKEIIYNELGIKSSIYDCRCNEITKTLAIHGIDNIIKFLDWIYKDSELHLERKFNQYRSIIENTNNSQLV